jgi:hypothetical protein
MELPDEVGLEILEGMIEIGESEISEKVLEILITSRSQDLTYRDLFNQIGQCYRKTPYYDKLINSINKLEGLDLLEIVFKSLPHVKITRRGMETLRAHRLMNRVMFESLITPIKNELNLKDKRFDELVGDAKHYCIESLEEIKKSYNI